MSESPTAKRKDAPSGATNQSKKAKTKKSWQIPKRGAKANVADATIEPGDAGIWITCDMHKESKCVGELRDLFQEYAEKLYKTEPFKNQSADFGFEGEADIEADIQNELQALRNPDSKPIFNHIRVDVPCVLFFKTLQPVEPVSFVHAICRDAFLTGTKKTRNVRRLTPMTLIGKATEKGLEQVANIVLKPHFHARNGEERKFAIRVSIRNHGKVLTRTNVINQVAILVGPGHKVDLEHPDLLILVEVCKGICGMSVVGKDFEELKRFNLAEIFQSNSPALTT